MSPVGTSRAARQSAPAPRLQRVHHRIDLAPRVAQALLDLLIEPLPERLLAVAQLLLAPLELRLRLLDHLPLARDQAVLVLEPLPLALDLGEVLRELRLARRPLRARLLDDAGRAGRAASRSRAPGCCPAIRSADGRSARTFRGLNPNPADVTPSVVDA